MVLSVQGRDSLTLEMENPWYLEKLRICLIQRSPAITMLNRIIRNNFTIKEFSAQLKESIPQVKKRVTRIRRWLQPLQLTLRRNTFELTGEEVQIREFIHQFYQITSYPLDESEYSSFSEEAEFVYRKIVLFFHMRLNFLQEQQLFSIISIQLDRINRRKSVVFNESHRSYCLNSSLFASLLSQLKQRTGMALSTEEYMYLFLMVQAKFSDNFNQRIKEKFIHENYINKTTAYIQTSYGAELLKSSFKECDFLFDKDVYTSLLSFHLYYDLISTMLYEDISLIEQSFSTYPVLFHKLSDGFQKVKKENLHFQRITKLQFLFRYFFIFSEMLSPVSIEPQKNIYLVLNWKQEQKKQLTKTIASHFKNRKNIRFVEGKIYSEYKNADVILTNLIHPFFIEQDVHCPVLTIPEIPEEVLLKQLEQILSGI
uniref:Mga helix-turn-helix domain-containing protein n=1 Tax=Candidatus Enterococcus clewellii TaxID=1834193 RepID=A0A242KD97_9ENTE|nr:hypothetical protein A5888_000958 [Enterococcus sp. 9E7_DIV0242]